jgi:hypothetical protein
VLPGLEGTIRPVKVKPKPAVRVKHDTLINKVRLWMLNLPKGSIVTSQQIKTAFDLNDGMICWVIRTLLGDHVIRRKRDITGKFKKGTYVRLGKTADAALKRRLRGKRVS